MQSTKVFTIFSLCWLVILYAAPTNSTSNPLVLQCPLHQLHFQKIVGFRPPLEYMTERNLLYRPQSARRLRRVTRAESNETTSLPLKKGNYTNDLSSAGPEEPPFNSRPKPEAIVTGSSLCWTLCQADDGCLAYVHLLDTDECFAFTHKERAANYHTVTSELPLVADAEAIFYEKTCLRVPESCKSRLWTLTKIPGNSLVMQGKKTIATLVTRRECAERCLFETEFRCLSASFAPSHRNNRERFSEHTPLTGKPHITVGRCILSDKDKMIQPDAFRAAPYDEEYIENQCYERPAENDNCSYELYANSSFVYAEAKYMGLTQKECQSLCSHETRFYCQGVSYFFDRSDPGSSECSLHSEDIISMGPRSLQLKENSVYMRRVKCLDVQVVCSRNEMTVKYTPHDFFVGKMYASMHSSDCMVQGNGTRSTVLQLAIGSEVKENRCGILRAYEVTKNYQRIFISTLLVVQNNPNVQTQGDRLIKVGCIMSSASFIAADGGENTSSDDPESNDDPVDGDDEDEPNAIALESSLAFTQQSLPNEGAVHYNITNDHILPKVTLQIVDLAHQHETSDVQIGQNLELQIAAEYSPLQLGLEAHQLPPLPDFRATSLVARTQNNENYVMLIDERGCPTDMTVFPALQRMRSERRNLLHSRFHAFKFAGTSMVNFDVKIHFCHRPCPEENCIQYGGASKKAWSSGGGDGGRRRRRQSTGGDGGRRRRRQSTDGSGLGRGLRVQNPVYISTVMDVLNDPAVNVSLTRSRDSGEVPLNYNLRVHGPDMTNSNSFIYGERGVLLIAGIDDQLRLDNICLNQSLLIALLIFWLIFQVALSFSCCYVIQKYKRLAKLDDERRKIHEEYLESRRVHWADQGGYTL